MVEHATALRWFAVLAVGDRLPALVSAPITRTTLALYCGASGDHNPIHVDIDFARCAGLGDVIAHGMLSTAYIARLLTDWAPQAWLRALQVRFVSITHVGDSITCDGEVIAITRNAGLMQVRVALTARNAAGDTKLQGEASFATPTH